MQALCNQPECFWKTVEGLMEGTAKKLATAHVIIEHPDEYTRITGKTPPEIDEMTKFELEAWTQR